MKINWGYKIAIIYVIFAAGIMTMVYMTTLQNRDLVTDDYYEQELAYQQVIDRSANTAGLSQQLSIARKDNKLIIAFPAEFSGISAKGEWSLYYAADKKKDLNGSFSTNSAVQELNIPREASGNYLLKLNWECRGEKFYFEQSIFL